MKRRIMKKSELLKEGYVKGLKKAQRVINEMLSENTNISFVIFDDTWKGVESQVERIKEDAMEDPDMFSYAFDEESYERYEESQDINDLEFDEDALYDTARENITIFTEEKMSEIRDVLDEKVLVCAELGLWNGNREGKRVYEDANKAIWSLFEDDGVLYVDNQDNLVLETNHHDGTNTFYFYVYNQKAVDEFSRNNPTIMEKLEMEEDNTLYDIDELLYAYEMEYISEKQFDEMLTPLGREVRKALNW